MGCEFAPRTMCSKLCSRTGPDGPPAGRNQLADSPASRFLASATSGRPWSASLILSGGDEAFELLEPVLDENHLGHRRRLRFLRLQYQKALTISRQVPVADRTTRPQSRRFE